MVRSPACASSPGWDMLSDVTILCFQTFCFNICLEEASDMYVTPWCGLLPPHPDSTSNAPMLGALETNSTMWQWGFLRRLVPHLRTHDNLGGYSQLRYCRPRDSPSSLKESHSSFLTLDPCPGTLVQDSRIFVARENMFEDSIFRARAKRKAQSWEWHKDRQGWIGLSPVILEHSESWRTPPHPLCFRKKHRQRCTLPHVTSKYLTRCPCAPRTRPDTVSKFTFFAS